MIYANAFLLFFLLYFNKLLYIKITQRIMEKIFYIIAHLDLASCWPVFLGIYYILYSSIIYYYIIYILVLTKNAVKM